MTTVSGRHTHVWWRWKMLVRHIVCSYRGEICFLLCLSSVESLKMEKYPMMSYLVMHHSEFTDVRLWQQYRGDIHMFDGVEKCLLGILSVRTEDICYVSLSSLIVKIFLTHILLLLQIYSLPCTSLASWPIECEFCLVQRRTRCECITPVSV